MRKQLEKKGDYILDYPQPLTSPTLLGNILLLNYYSALYSRPHKRTFSLNSDTVYTVTRGEV